MTTIDDGGCDPPARELSGDWQGNEREQLRAWLKATPAQRLAWLEEAIRLAHQAGALPSRADKPRS